MVDFWKGVNYTIFILGDTLTSNNSNGEFQMLQAIRSASGLISLLFFFIAVGSDNWPATLCSATIAFLFAVVEYEEAKELGFFNAPTAQKKISLQNQQVARK